MPKKINALSQVCLGCGDSMIYNPETSSLFCPSCKQTKTILYKHGMAKHDVKSSISINNRNKAWAETKKYMQCPNCGAATILKNFDVASSCPYCDTYLIASKNELNIQKPDGIIPFAFSKKQAELKFKESLKNKTLAPKQFKANIKADEIHAYYFPTFVFNANCLSSYVGELYKNKTETDKDGIKTTRRKYFTIQGSKQTKHESIELNASSKLNQSELDEILPYDLKQIITYNDDFIYGYELECNAKSVSETSQEAKEIIEDSIKDKILQDHSYDGIENLDISTSYNSFTYSHCVLPVYRFNFTYKDKKYSNVMNGQTGKLTGSYPKSSAKIALLIAGILLALGLPFLLVLLLII